jgi:DNA adenine methylase
MSMKTDLAKTKPLKPPLKWAGGKRWLLPHLMPLWAPYCDKRLVEPLCGGLAVTLGLLPARALLNDVNPHLINFFRWLQKGFKISLKMENDKTLYYEHRELFNALIKAGKENTKITAELFYYLNRTGYNGLCRFNQSGEFNVPFGSYKTINYIRDYQPYKEVFAAWTFSCKEFDRIKLEADDFIYADPPYDVEFTSYSKDGFTWADQLRLVKWLAKHPGPVVLSNQATECIVELYTDYGFNIAYYDAPRRISCNGDRSPAKEVLATKGL